jgi:hypothetical protein
MNKKNIYELKLHETTEVAKNLYATRVPGGWVYDSVINYDNIVSVFVPYNDEFLKDFATGD